MLRSSLSEHRCPLQLSPGWRQSSLTMLCLIIWPKWKLTAHTIRKQGPTQRKGWYYRNDRLFWEKGIWYRHQPLGTTFLGGLTAPCCPLCLPHRTGIYTASHQSMVSKGRVLPDCKTSCTKKQKCHSANLRTNTNRIYLRSLVLKQSMSVTPQSRTVTFCDLQQRKLFLITKLKSLLLQNEAFCLF